MSLGFLQPLIRPTSVLHARYTATALDLRPSQLRLYPGHPNLAWIYLFGGHHNIVGKTLVPLNDAGNRVERFEAYTFGRFYRQSSPHSAFHCEPGRRLASLTIGTAGF